MEDEAGHRRLWARSCDKDLSLVFPEGARGMFQLLLGFAYQVTQNTLYHGRGWLGGQQQRALAHSLGIGG